MKYCAYCGQIVRDNIKYCTNCGIKLDREVISNTEKRTVNYGQVYKCPNCGEVIDAFSLCCPACGFEIRGAKASPSMSEFASSLANAMNDDQKISIIRSYPIPNTKEDIFEFMIMASSNCKNISGEHNIEELNAWQSKFEQAYQKATLMFRKKDLVLIESLYEKTTGVVKKTIVMNNAHKVGDIVSKIASVVFSNLIICFTIALCVAFGYQRWTQGNFAGVDIAFDILFVGIAYKISHKFSGWKNKDSDDKS